MGTDNNIAEFLEKYPLGQVPMFEGSDFGFGESLAILRYLLNTKSSSETYWPKDYKA